MDAPKPAGSTHSLLSVPTLNHQHFHHLGAELASRFEDGKRLAGNLISSWSAALQTRVRLAPSWPALYPIPFASLGQANIDFDVAISSDFVTRTLAGAAVYTISYTNNDFVLISDPNGAKSVGLLYFRREDAEAFLAQAYMLKVEGIAFRFLPDPVQIRNALEMKGADNRSGFDGVPVFQSDLLAVKWKNKCYLLIFFRKVGSLENVLKKMEMSEKELWMGRFDLCSTRK